ncbi:hypothetical protein JCM14036_27480 [Desulfotomaculum defluvii]
MKDKKFKQLILLLVILSFVFISGCPGQEAQPKPEPQQKIKIGISLASMEFDGNKTIKKFMQERAKKEKVSLTWMDAKMDSSQQEKDIDKLIQEKVQAIILQTVDPKEGTQLVDKIVQAKIKVIGLETLPYNAPLDGYVAADHIRAGELQGQFILNEINKTSEQAKQSFKILMLKGDPMDPVSQMIIDGARQVLEQSKKIEQITVKEHPEGDPEMAQMTVMNTLQEGSIDAIIATDDRMAESAFKALKSENKDKMVLTIGVGADQKTSEALVKGDHDAEIDIMPEQLANFALDAALDLAQKGNWNNDTIIQNGNFDIPAKIIPVRLIDKEQSHLLEARWGNLKKEEEKPQEGQSGQQQGQEQQQGSSGEESGQSGGQGSGSQGGSQGEKSKKSKLKIVTQDGKVMEVEVDGEIQKIEQDSGGQQGQEGQGQQGQGSQGGGGQ